MLIPLTTDRYAKRRPVINQALIGINIVVYAFGALGARVGTFELGAVADWGHFVLADFRSYLEILREVEGGKISRE